MKGTRIRAAVAASTLALAVWALAGPGRIAAATRTAACATKAKATTNYQTPVRLEVTCTGSGVARLRVVGRPSHGALRDRVFGGDQSRRTMTVTYVPNKLFVGADRLKLEARQAGRRSLVTARIAVLPWRMRAFGDSATAGFGFLGTTGKEIAAGQLEQCEPPTPLNDRCSSNSNAGPGTGGKPTWRPDSGLANNISWAAQFANSLQGGGHITGPEMFQNHAVSGSTPADWVKTTGQLHGELKTILNEDPDLIAFTLGVNPLLDMILEEGVEGPCIRGAGTAKKVAECMKKPFEKVELRKLLAATYKALLQGAADAQVVTFQYHLAFPLVAAFPNFFLPWQIEAVIAALNAEIKATVATVKAALPKDANRLTLIEAQVDPNKPDPLKVARFDLGIPKSPAQSWTPQYTCSESSVAVDGASHQATGVQESFDDEYKGKFCKGEAWVISADTGIHPNEVGYGKFAQALINVARARGLVPKLP